MNSFQATYGDSEACLLTQNVIPGVSLKTFEALARPACEVLSELQLVPSLAVIVSIKLLSFSSVSSPLSSEISTSNTSE